jgi:hypothetical protein
MTVLLLLLNQINKVLAVASNHLSMLSTLVLERVNLLETNDALLLQLLKNSVFVGLAMVDLH